MAGAVAVGGPRHRAERRRYPFAGAVGLRARELARRPVVLAAFLLQATAVAGAELLAAVTGDGLAEAGDDLVLGGLRVTAVPGGLMFGVLVAAVVGSEFGWATERALLARDPRRLRFAGLQLAVAAVLALTWWAVQSLVAVTVAALLQAGGGIDAGAAWIASAHRAALVAALAATLVYGLLGAACALVLRGALAGVVALLAYGLLGELVLAPQWPTVAGWTLYASAARLAGQGTTPVPRAALVVIGAFTLAMAGCLALYARRQVRD
ncbi:MAG TPA: hypothetical protein VFX88_03620 [Actinomycetota bacterium]|nr:hypothetical protein [Actinomycetota bacterium]